MESQEEIMKGLYTPQQGKKSTKMQKLAGCLPGRNMLVLGKMPDQADRSRDKKAARFQ